ncbi:MAG: ABC transporter permease subunit [Limnochordales bacterium]|nr:hypothetical protein [Bacillota bacterium]
MRTGRRIAAGKDVWLAIVSVLSIAAVWMLVSHVLSPAVFPGPKETLQFLWQEWQRGRLWRHVSVTMERVLLSFAISMTAGVIAGILMGTLRWAERLGSAWLLTGLSIPRVVPIVVAYILIGLNDTAAVVAIVLVVAPSVVTQIQEGARALDQKLIQMAHAFRLSRWALLRHVVAPQLFPYIAGTARSAMSLAWKMVVFAELVGRSSGVGYQISFFFQMFDMRGILAYGLVMVVILAAIDRLMMRAWDWYAFRWRSRQAVWTGQVGVS